MVHTKIHVITLEMWNTISVDILSSKKHFEKYIQDYLMSIEDNSRIIDLKVTFPSVLSSDDRHTIHRYSQYLYLYSESIDIKDDRVLHVILTKNYLQEIMNKDYSYLKSKVPITEVTQPEIPQITPVTQPEIPQITQVVFQPITTVTGLEGTMWEYLLPKTEFETKPSVEEKKYQMDDVINVLNKKHIQLFNPYTLNETIKTLESDIEENKLLLQSYITDLEVLKSVKQAQGARIALDIICKKNA